MSTTNSTSAELSNQSSGSEKTSGSGNSRKRTYTKSCNSPSLRAFQSLGESLAQFFTHVMMKTAQMDTGNVHYLLSDLEGLKTNCENMEKQFQCFISYLDKAIEDYETKKPADLSADANSVISPEVQAANRSSSSKIQKTKDEIITALISSAGKIAAVIFEKIIKSRYGDYTISMGKKLKNLKNMCEDQSKVLEDIGKMIKEGILRNEQLRSNLERHDK